MIQVCLRLQALSSLHKQQKLLLRQMRKLRPKVTREWVIWEAGSEVQVSKFLIRSLGTPIHLKTPQGTFGVYCSGGSSLCSLTLGRRSSISQKLWRRLAQAFPPSHPTPPHLSGGGGGLVGTHFRAGCLGQGSQGTSKTAEYSATAILSSPMTSVFALDQKVRASSHCLPSAPRPIWPPPWPELPFPGCRLKGKCACVCGEWGAKKLQGMLAAQSLFNRGTTWVGGTALHLHGTIGADGCPQATSSHYSYPVEKKQAQRRKDTCPRPHRNQ